MASKCRDLKAKRKCLSLRGHKYSYFRSTAYKYSLSKAKYCGVLQF